METKFKDATTLNSIATQVALAADEIIHQLIKVDWHTPNNIDIQKKMIHLIGDYLIDEVRDKYQINISFEEIDTIAERIVDVAKIRYK